MKGLELAKKYYETYGKEMIHNYFPDFESKIAVGLCGSGSECFGFDDEISQDHDFEPGFCMFVGDEIDEKNQFELMKAYNNLPRSFEGYERKIVTPAGGNRHGVIKIKNFFEAKTGTMDGELTIFDWLNVPEQNLAECTNGEIWRDDSKVLSRIRVKLMCLPTDIKLKKMAGELLIMGQTGQYNFKRCIKHGELTASKLALHEFVKSAIHFIFLENEVYMPYYKWIFKIFRNMFWPKSISDYEKRFSKLLSISDDMLKNEMNVQMIENEIEDIASEFIEKLKSEGLSCDRGNDLERYAYEVNNKIRDISLRNKHILAGV